MLWASAETQLRQNLCNNITAIQLDYKSISGDSKYRPRFSDFRMGLYFVAPSVSS
jgi:hypothetical protein